MTRFADDHFIEALRGLRRPGQARIRATFARRAALLQKRIAEMSLGGFTGPMPPPMLFALDELMAIAIAMEKLESGETAAAPEVAT